MELLDTSGLEAGLHTVAVRCGDGAAVDLAVQVLEPSQSSTGGPVVVSTLLLFLSLAAGATIVTPSGPGTGHSADQD